MPDLDIAADILTRASQIVALAADVVITGASRNAYAGREITSKDGGIPLDAVFVQVYGGRLDLHNDGAMRWPIAQVVVRGARNAEALAAARANRIWEALNLSGPFTGVSTSASYKDMRCQGACAYPLPIEDSDAEYFALDVEAWLI